MITVPPDFGKFIIDLFEERGEAWLAKLPFLVTEFEEKWAFKAESPFPDLSYNLVIPVIRSAGGEAVLKLGVPRDELKTEIEALRLYNGLGMVRLLEADPEAGVMLLERIRPGKMLLTLAERDDEAATMVAADLMQQIWRPLPEKNPFPTIADWSKALNRHRSQFNGGVGPLPKKIFEEAEAHFRELSASMAPPVLLHGDLHHWNIMTAERQPWLGIDPKGLAGEPAYEVGPLLYNPVGILLKWSNPQKLTRRRIDILAECLGIDRQRIIGWGVYQCVLSACWSLEDEGYGWEEAIEIAKLIRRC